MSDQQTTHRPIDKIFAENLGLSYGGCVRDLANTLFNREVAEAAGVKLCPIPLLGGREKRRMRAFWAANLQAVALWVTLDKMPEFGDDKLLRKMIFNMQGYVDQALGRPLFSKLDPDDLERYSTIRSRMSRAALARDADKESIARAFLAELHQMPPEHVPDSRVTATATHIGMSAGLFLKLLNISLNSPNSWDRAKH